MLDSCLKLGPQGSNAGLSTKTNEIVLMKDYEKLDHLDYYSFFTKYSLMEEYGFGSGIVKRLFRKVLPAIPENDKIEYLLHTKPDASEQISARLDFETISSSPISEQLDLAIKALCSKVIAFGLDRTIKGKYTTLSLDSAPFERLLARMNNLGESGDAETIELIDSLDAIDELIIGLRKNKHKIGINFHLTLTTRRILEYTEHVKKLLHLKRHIKSPEAWQRMFSEFIAYTQSKNSLRRYVRRHSDLVALEIVEHTSNKGEKYIAENKKEYWSFFNRSLLGGAIIAVFAFFKIFIDSFDLPQFNNAVLFSINYASCFVLVKLLGGIIATKQPAMTASTIAKNIDKQDDLKIDSIESVVLLAKKVFRSQFISIMGNFLMALSLAIVLMLILQATDTQSIVDLVDPQYLMKTIQPSFQLVSYAAIAGFFLALSGLISGYFDNKVIASKIAHRIKYSKLFLNSTRLGNFVDKKIGALLGNVFLGIFLGSVFLLSNVVPLKIDIRHIAFSSANLGYSITNYSFDYQTILLGVAGVLLIGLVNFIISFSITLYLALKSRGGNFRILPKIAFGSLKDFLRNPISYFIDRPQEP